MYIELFSTNFLLEVVKSIILQLVKERLQNRLQNRLQEQQYSNIAQLPLPKHVYKISIYYDKINIITDIYGKIPIQIYPDDERIERELKDKETLYNLIGLTNYVKSNFDRLITEFKEQQENDSFLEKQLQEFIDISERGRTF